MRASQRYAPNGAAIRGINPRPVLALLGLLVLVTGCDSAPPAAPTPLVAPLAPATPTVTVPPPTLPQPSPTSAQAPATSTSAAMAAPITAWSTTIRGEGATSSSSARTTLLPLR